MTSGPSRLPRLFSPHCTDSTSSVAYGHFIGKALAFAYIKPEAAAPGTALEAVIMNEARKAAVPCEAS